MALAAEPDAPRQHPRRLRLRYGREGRVRFLSHLDLVRAIERAVRRTPLQAAYTEGFHARLRMSFASALPVGAESVGEWLDLDLVASDPTDAQQVKAVLNQALPEGLRILEAAEVRFPCKSLGGLIGMSVWRLSGPDLSDAAPRIAQALQAETLPIVRKSQRRDVRPYLERIEPHPDYLEAWVRITQTGSVKPDELLTVLGYTPEQRQQFRACRQALLCQGPDGWTDPWGEQRL